MHSSNQTGDINNRIKSHTQDATALQPNVFLAIIRQLLVTTSNDLTSTCATTAT